MCGNESVKQKRQRLRTKLCVCAVHGEQNLRATSVACLLSEIVHRSKSTVNTAGKRLANVTTEPNIGSYSVVQSEIPNGISASRSWCSSIVLPSLVINALMIQRSVFSCRLVGIIAAADVFTSFSSSPVFVVVLRAGSEGYEDGSKSRLLASRDTPAHGARVGFDLMRTEAVAAAAAAAGGDGERVSA